MSIDKDPLAYTLETLCQLAGLKITSPSKQEVEGSDYHAHQLEIESKHVLFRVGKTTPNRPGNFVTLWKRPKKNIEPIDIEDEIDCVIVYVSNEANTQQGLFILDKDILLKKKIFSMIKQEKRGKLAFRVFPPWATPSPSALNTQKWQLNYFVSEPINQSDLIKLTRPFKTH